MIAELQRTLVTVTIFYSDSFLVPKRTFLCWKSSDTVTIAYSDTFYNPHLCHCSQSSLHKARRVSKLAFEMETEQGRWSERELRSVWNGKASLLWGYLVSRHTCLTEGEEGPHNFATCCSRSERDERAFSEGHLISHSRQGLHFIAHQRSLF